MTKSVDKLTFEEAFSELDAIVAKLENETLSLEDSLALYERGQALSTYCAGLLEKAELRLEEIRISNQEGDA